LQVFLIMAEKKSTSEKKKKPKEKMKRSFKGKVFRFFLWFGIFIILCSGLGLAGLYYYMGEDLPRIESLTDYRPSIITTVYADDDSKIAEFFKERRVVTPLSEMPKQLLQAFIAAEDSRFYKHKGIDLISIARAFFKNIEAGTIVQGGSTITQQVTKSFFLTPERSYQRKIKEAILAYRIDKAFKKEEILFLYLNQIYLGHGAYGVQAAAENYFDKSPSELNLAECAILAGLPQAPSRYSPFRFPERAKERQIYVLNRMVEEQFITQAESDAAIRTLLDIKPRKNWYIEEVPFYTEHIRRYIVEKYGTDTLYREGLKIYTAVDVDMQKAAREEIRKGLMDLDKRQGYRGPIKTLALEQIEAFSKKLQEDLEKDPPTPGKTVQGVVIAVDDTEKTVKVRMGNAQGVIGMKSMRWARKPNPEVIYFEAGIRRPSRALSVGDVIRVNVKERIGDTDSWQLTLEQKPKAQGALLCLEAGTGLLKVMIGGRDFRETQFNRAFQSRRQPGSAFKPIIYAAALDKGFTAASVIIDSPIVTKDLTRDFTWKPKNYGKKFQGPTLFRKALAKSKNVITIKILKNIGIDYAIDYARKLGVHSDISRNLSIALGSSGLSVLEIVKAYSVFCNNGDMIEPIFIKKIVDRYGSILEENLPVRQKVIEKTTAYIVTNLLESVVKEGTGRRIRALKRPVAGKTGTTNNLFDAWFVGYTPQYITGVWVGFDEAGSLGKGETGSRAASPIWLGFMQQVLKDKPVKVFEAPKGVVFAKIDAETGLLPIPESKKTIFECFKEGTVPVEHTKKPDTIQEADEFFKSIM
jgi:penicillin-binding protein 1A